MILSALCLPDLMAAFSMQLTMFMMSTALSTCHVKCTYMAHAGKRLNSTKQHSNMLHHDWLYLGPPTGTGIILHLQPSSGLALLLWLENSKGLSASGVNDCDAVLEHCGVLCERPPEHALGCCLGFTELSHCITRAGQVSDL